MFRLHFLLQYDRFLWNGWCWHRQRYQILIFQILTTDARNGDVSLFCINMIFFDETDAVDIISVIKYWNCLSVYLIYSLDISKVKFIWKYWYQKQIFWDEKFTFRKCTSSMRIEMSRKIGTVPEMRSVKWFRTSVFEITRVKCNILVLVFRS